STLSASIGSMAPALRAVSLRLQSQRHVVVLVTGPAAIVNENAPLVRPLRVDLDPDRQPRCILPAFRPFNREERFTGQEIVEGQVGHFGGTQAIEVRVVERQAAAVLLDESESG